MPGWLCATLSASPVSWFCPRKVIDSSGQRHSPWGPHYDVSVHRHKFYVGLKMDHRAWSNMGSWGVGGASGQKVGG